MPFICLFKGKKSSVNLARTPRAPPHLLFTHHFTLYLIWSQFSFIQFSMTNLILLFVLSTLIPYFTKTADPELTLLK